MSWTLLLVGWGILTVGILIGGLLCSVSRQDDAVMIALQDAALREHDIDMWWMTD